MRRVPTVSGSVRAVTPAGWFVAAIALMIVLDAVTPGARWLRAPWRLVGLVVAAAGVALHVAATRHFRHHHTTHAPLARPAALVTDGPYHHTRNPMYLAGVLMLLGLDALLGSATPLLVLPLWMVLMRARFIRPEEALLARTFGQAYAAYRTRVRRWI